MKKIIILLLWVLVGANVAFAQTKVTGTVTDESTGEPLAFVTVVVKGTTANALTADDGSFSITVPAAAGAAAQLQFSSMGYETAEVAVAGKKELAVKMKPSATMLDKVVVTGIFNKSKESYTGAVTTITAEELAQAGNQNLLSRISNIDPSFVVMESNLFGSDPNVLPDIQMRGSTSLSIGLRETQEDARTTPAANLPLFIVDGFEVDLKTVMNMDPSLVESMTLLKDASATAMYGSRGANGIMVIVKRQPEPGRLRVTYKGDINIAAPDFTSYNLMNASEKIQYEVAAGLYTNESAGAQVSLDALYSARRAEVARGVDTYWLKYPVRVGIGQRHSLYVEGGDQSLLYSINGSYNNTMGVMKASGNDALAGNVYLQYTYKKLRIQNDLGVSVYQTENSPYGNFSDYAKLNAYWTPYDEEGKLKKYADRFQPPGQAQKDVGNPLYDASLPYRNDSHEDRFYNNFSVNWEFLPGAALRGRFQVSKSTGSSDVYVSAQHSKFGGNSWVGENYTRRGSYTYGSSSTFNYEGDITVNFNKTLNEVHQLYIGGSFNFAQEKSEGNTINAEGYAVSNMIQLGLANAYERDGSPSSYDSWSRRLGFVVNFNYSYDNKYYIDMAARLDGSSRFGSDNKMAPFWSTGVGWNLHNEAFIKEVEFIDYLRLRASFGTSGSQNFNPYQARTTFSYDRSNTYQYWTGASMMALGNPDLKWQVTNTFNGGFEFGLFGNRWKLNVDVYNKLTDGVLMDIDLPLSSGFNNYKANLGEVENRGFELGTSAVLFRDQHRGINWQVGVSVLRNRNKVLKISNAIETLNNNIINDEDKYRNPSFLVREGESLNTIFAVKSLGIDPSTGLELLEKLNGTHTFTWDTEDRIACGVSDPTFWGNFNTSFRYQNLTLNLTFSYRTGGYLYNQTLVDKIEGVDPWYNADKRVYDDRWKEPGDLARFKGVMWYQQASNASSRFVMQEHTIDCRLINLSYEVNPEWLKQHLKLAYLSFAAFTENPFRISSIRQERGTSYPFARSYSFSITARF